MSRWFRHYAGMCRDDKLVRVALRSRQTIERVVWVYAAILESAAEIDEAGRYEIDAHEMAYFLRCEEGDVAAIINQLEDTGRVSLGVVTNWGARQFQSDRSAERTRRYRDKNKPSPEREETSQNEVVTSQTRHRDAPETETETYTETPVGAFPPTLQLVSDTPEAELYRRGKQVLGKSAGGLIKKLLTAKGGSIAQARAAIETASEKGDPGEYIGAIIRGREHDGRSARERGYAW